MIIEKFYILFINYKIYTFKELQRFIRIKVVEAVLEGYANSHKILIYLYLNNKNFYSILLLYLKLCKLFKQNDANGIQN